MDSYSLVEPPVRRKLEEMLLTWKSPPPGATNSQPLFPAEITRKIDNALIKARTAAVQAQQKQMKADHARLGMQPGGPNSAVMNPALYRSTPTPPVPGPGPVQNTTYNQAPQVHEPTTDANSNHGNVSGKILELHSRGLLNLRQLQPILPNPTPVNNISPNALQQLAAQLNGLTNVNMQSMPTADILLKDMRALIATTQTKFAENPFDLDVQKRLKALLDLQAILNSQQLPPDQLAVIRDQLSKIAVSVGPAQPPPMPVSQPPLQAMPLGLTGTNNLAALLGGFAKPNPAPPTQFAALQSLPMMTASLGSAAPPPNYLFASLMRHGLLNSSTSTPQPQIGTLNIPTQLNQNLPLSKLTGTPPIRNVQFRSGPGVDWENLDVELSSASLKM